ncbi:F-box domain-containing protein [Caenorhabditis elegans]|uniref:F-box domain-containing protein n=1 Tax=Caenorhabditis elegans TaxID=6239 RepID=Q9U2W8_CAEEL|nr:F-box domain-containing protein [Caenorhabditis elegans]CAB54338.1 F-box domain-containing protein [Caenorhabditis elegans]|eukprot:NP_507893.1 F-box A protein [Caenorhabditis elegans]
MAEKLEDALKAIEISGPPSLSDMPMDVMHVIVDHLDAMDRLILRYVNRKMRNFVDNKKPNFKNIEVKAEDESYKLVLDQKSTIVYNSNGSGCIAKYDERWVLKINKDELAVMFDDVAVWMKYPKLRLDEFKLSAGWDYMMTINLLKEIKDVEDMFQAKKVILDVFEFCRDAFSILSHFEPGILEEIGIFCSDVYGSIHKLFTLEQWKQAKSVTLKCIEGIDIPIEHLFHLSRFDITLSEVSVSDARKIRDVLMKSAQFECGEICLLFDSDLRIEADVVRVFNPNFVDEYVSRPLQFKVEQFLVIIHKTSLRIKKIENPH